MATGGASPHVRGNTGSHRSARRRRAVHPRVRREHIKAAATGNPLIGSSPQARGTRTTQTPSRRPATVHPRRRGEHAESKFDHSMRVGSSPQARGTLRAVDKAEPSGRFIPAGAGNTAAGWCRRSTTPVHPRRRGEHVIESMDVKRTYGSSPQARGTLFCCWLQIRRLRFIPAGAGNTPRSSDGLAPWTVHPRRRGEHYV